MSNIVREVMERQHHFASVMTPEAFTAWLEKQPIDHVFTGCNAGRCPVAEYLRDMFRSKHVGVGHQTVHVDLVVFGLPQWAQDFIAQFDNVFSCSSVTVAAVIRMMRPAEQSMSSAGHSAGAA